MLNGLAGQPAAVAASWITLSMPNKIGEVEALFRYPVKSMSGESLELADLGWHGLGGDRRLAFRRLADRGGFPWLTASRLPQLIRFAPQRREAAVAGSLPTHVRTPEGEELAIVGPELAADIGRRHGSPVEMVHLDRGIFDEASISLITSATVVEISELAAQRPDVRRFRPNILIAPARALPFEEDEWVGGVLTFGEANEAPAICITNRDERCAMVNFDPDTAPNVTNPTQKGSLLIWPDVRIDAGWNTLVRVQNDGSQDVDVLCYYMDGNKNRVDFVFTVTRNAPFWFDARTGNGSSKVNRFPQSQANGFDNPFLVTTGAAAEGVPWTTGPIAGNTDDAPPFFGGPYLKGLLACLVEDSRGWWGQVKWNHLSGTATLYHQGNGTAYEYNAFAFFVPTGTDLEPVPGQAFGMLNLNGVEYDACPLYLIGQFSPPGVIVVGAPPVLQTRLAIAGCTLNLRQDWLPVFTKLQFDVWNEDEVKFTGAFECADSWHETEFEDVLDATNGGPVDSGAQNFTAATLGTYSARYRVQGVKSAECERAAATNQPAIVTQAVGLLGVHYTTFGGPTRGGGTTIAQAGKISGQILVEPSGFEPEGGIRHQP